MPWSSPILTYRSYLQVRWNSSVFYMIVQLYFLGINETYLAHFSIRKLLLKPGGGAISSDRYRQIKTLLPSKLLSQSLIYRLVLRSSIQSDALWRRRVSWSPETNFRSELYAVMLLMRGSVKMSRLIKVWIFGRSVFLLSTTSYWSKIPFSFTP